MIVYVFFLIILFLLFLIEIRNRETDISTNGTVSVNSITEGFESGNGIYTGTLTALIQVDDQFEVYHKGKHVGSGNGWNRAFEITIPNVAEGDKIVIRCNNGGGPGGIIAKFTYNGKDYFSNKDNIIFTGRYLNDGTLSGSKYVGCFNDRADRDMRGDYGWGFSPEQCARVTARDGYPYYAIQAGSYCFGSHNYGRYGQSDNCNQRCSNQGSEFCGGGWANKIWAKNEQPERIDMGTRSNSIWGGNTDARFGDNARWVWVKHGHRSDDYATGWWECYFKLPTFQKIGYCADPTYQEFNPGACSNPINTERCIATTLNNYTFDASMCKNKLDFYNHDKFYVCMNKVFKMLKKIDELKNFNDDVYVQVIVNKINQNNQTIIGANFISGFIKSNLELIRILMLAANKIKYPIDEKYLTKNQMIEPDSPQYYEIIKRLAAWSQQEKHKNDYLAKQFNNYYKEVYNFGRVIANSPRIVETCACLFEPANAVCMPCNSTKEVPIEFHQSKNPEFIPVYSKGSFGNLDRGKQVIDDFFAQNKIFKRECTNCADSHKVIFYKRITPINNFSMYENIINTWSSNNNTLNTDFKLYSSYDDLLKDRNAWTYCNYNDLGIGFPRDCGPNTGVGFQWNSVNRGGQPNVKYSILTNLSK